MGSRLRFRVRLQVRLQVRVQVRGRVRARVRVRMPVVPAGAAGSRARTQCTMLPLRS